MTATPREAFNARELAPRVESNLRIADRVYGRHSSDCIFAKHTHPSCLTRAGLPYISPNKVELAVRITTGSAAAIALVHEKQQLILKGQGAIMPPLSVTIDKNNNAPSATIGPATAYNTINWSVEGDAGDLVIFFFEVEGPDRGPFNTPGGSGPARGLYNKHFPNSNAQTVPSGPLTRFPGKGQTEDWKYSVIRIKANNQIIIVDPRVSVTA